MLSLFFRSVLSALISGSSPTWSGLERYLPSGDIMSKLRRISTPELDRFEGFQNAAQLVFRKGELSLTLEAALFEIVTPAISDEDVVLEAYPDGFNPIEHRAQRSLDEMVTAVHEVLRIPKTYWQTYNHVRGMIENKLRIGYWEHLEECFDYRKARIVELDPDVPWVNMGGFTFILYASDMSRCLLLVGNQTD